MPTPKLVQSGGGGGGSTDTLRFNRNLAKISGGSTSGGTDPGGGHGGGGSTAPNPSGDLSLTSNRGARGGVGSGGFRGSPQGRGGVVNIFATGGGPEPAFRQQRSNRQGEPAGEDGGLFGLSGRGLALAALAIGGLFVLGS